MSKTIKKITGKKMLAGALAPKKIAMSRKPTESDFLPQNYGPAMKGAYEATYGKVPKESLRSKVKQVFKKKKKTVAMASSNMNYCPKK